jgi:choline dehydrogenase-like flavoprotein
MRRDGWPVLTEARTLTDGVRLRADVCIVGAGAAGLSVAHELIRAGARVVVLESGGEVRQAAVQGLYRGEVDGDPYYALENCRSRMLGGTTNMWGGWCRPLDAVDFEARPSQGHDGWPIAFDDLRAFYQRAHEICRLGDGDYDAARRPDEGTPLLPREGAFEDAIFRIQPLRFGVEFLREFRDSARADLVLQGNASRLRMRARRDEVVQLEARTLTGRSFVIAADRYVVAAGGIENARLLLASGDGREAAPGNEHDQVGRYFCDHLHVPIGRVRARQDTSAFYGVHRRDDGNVRGGLRLREDVRRREQRLGFAVTLHEADDPHDVLSPAQTSDTYASLQYLVASARRGSMPDRPLEHAGTVLRHLPEAARLAYRRVVKGPWRWCVIGCRAEQTPSTENRVVLDSRRDALEMPRVRLHWRVAEPDLASIASAQALLADALSGEQVEMFPRSDGHGGGWSSLIAGGAHHMGTTRMHGDPRKGVVDEHCRVHGVANLYVAGSSVFPSAGWAPPTLTIVALAARLAAHLCGSSASTVAQDADAALVLT